MPHTLAQKILLAHTETDRVFPGEIVMVRCDVVMTNDISGPMAFRAMERMGVEKVFDPARVVVVPDHFTPAKDERSAELQKQLAEWAERQGVTYYAQGGGGATNTVLEFVGPGAEALTIDERLAVANMAVEAGAETGLFPADETVAGYLEGRTERPWQAERSDPGAEFARRLQIDLDSLPPLVALPHSPGNVVPLEQASGLKIDEVYIGN